MFVLQATLACSRCIYVHLKWLIFDSILLQSAIGVSNLWCIYLFYIYIINFTYQSLVHGIIIMLSLNYKKLAPPMILYI